MYEEVTENELELLRTLRKIPYGQVTIFMHASQPVRIEKGIESKTLGKRNN